MASGHWIQRIEDPPVIVRLKIPIAIVINIIISIDTCFNSSCYVLFHIPVLRTFVQAKEEKFLAIFLPSFANA